MNKNNRNQIQFFILVIFVFITCILINNLIINLSRAGLGFDLSWLMKPASFALAEHVLPYKTSDTYAWAIFIGWLNSIKIIFFSLILSTFIGSVIGFSRISKNRIIKIISS